jgi:uncharacterized protein (TIGR02271 family)
MPTFTAMFNDRADAEQARADLGRFGIGASDVSIHDQQSAGLTSDSNRENEGGFFNSLREMFVPDEDSQTYGEGLRRGHFLLTVHTTDANADQVHQALESSRAVDVDESASSWRNEGWTGPNTGGTSRQAIGGTAGGASGAMASGSMASSGRTDEVIPIVEEQLAVGKREVNRGGVRVRSYVKQTPVHEQVSLREEHVEVERRPVNTQLGAADLDNAFQERNIELTETAEEAVVAKNARVVEEVVVHKDVGSHVEQIDDTVRRTDVDVERLGGTDTRTDTRTATGTGVERLTDTDRQTGTDRGALFGSDKNDRR